MWIRFCRIHPQLMYINRFNNWRLCFVDFPLNFYFLSEFWSSWMKKSPSARAQSLNSLAKGLEAKRRDIAASVSTQTGVSLDEAEKEVELSIIRLSDWAAYCDKLQGRSLVSDCLNYLKMYIPYVMVYSVFVMLKRVAVKANLLTFCPSAHATVWHRHLCAWSCGSYRGSPPWQ